MLLPFFLKLKAARLPVTLREYLSLLEGMKQGLADFDVEAFYFLARTCLVKDERHIDRFDQVFAAHFRGLQSVAGDAGVDTVALPEEWLKKLAERYLSEEEKNLVEALGGFEALMETLRQRLAEQDGRHQGGLKWIGTAGTSPFGAYGYNPEGVRIGQDRSRNRRAVKVWDRREFADLDDGVELGTRNIKIALRRLRRWVREGATEEFDRRHDPVDRAARLPRCPDAAGATQCRQTPDVLRCRRLDGRSRAGGGTAVFRRPE